MNCYSKFFNNIAVVLRSILTLLPYRYFSMPFDKEVKLKRVVFTLFLWMMGWAAATAQTIERSTIGAMGGYTGETHHHYHYTLGEPVAYTGNTTGIIATHGFQQPLSWVFVHVPENHLNLWSVQAFPNPVQGKLHLNYPMNDKGYEWALINLSGQLAEKGSLSGFSSTISMRKHRSGFYFLNILNKDDGSRHTIKLTLL